MFSMQPRFGFFCVICMVRFPVSILHLAPGSVRPGSYCGRRNERLVRHRIQFACDAEPWFGPRFGPWHGSRVVRFGFFKNAVLRWKVRFGFFLRAWRFYERSGSAITRLARLGSGFGSACMPRALPNVRFTPLKTAAAERSFFGENRTFGRALVITTITTNY